MKHVLCCAVVQYIYFLSSCANFETLTVLQKKTCFKTLRHESPKMKCLELHLITCLNSLVSTLPSKPNFLENPWK